MTTAQNLLSRTGQPEGEGTMLILTRRVDEAVIFGVCMVLAMTACVSVSLAPGADQVKMTKNPQDVASCRAVGNVKVPRSEQGTVDIATAEREFRNQVVGAGGNTGFVTFGPISVPSEGIAYHCS